jgi:diguanylate cyclase (GGDEF)-like protein
MTQFASGTVAGDAPSVVVLVGRTGLDAALRLDTSIELVRVKTASEAIAAVATESAARGTDATPMAVIVSEEVRDGLSVHDQSGVSGQQRFTRVLRNLRPGIEVMFLGEDGVTAEAIAAAARGTSAAPAHPATQPATPTASAAQSARAIVDDGAMTTSALTTAAMTSSTPVPSTPARSVETAGTQPAQSERTAEQASVPVRAEPSRVESASGSFAAPAFAPAASAAGAGLIGAAGLGAFASSPTLDAPPSGSAPLQVPRVEVVSPALSVGGGVEAMQPVMQPVIQPVIQPVMQPVMQPVIQPVMQPVMQPVSPPARELVPARSVVAPPLVAPVAPSPAALGALAELGAPALFGMRKDEASLEIGPSTPGDALLVRSLLRGQDVQGVAMELLRARAGDSSLEVVPEPTPGRLSVPLGEGAGWLTSSRAERSDQLRGHAAWLAGWLRLRDQQAALTDAALKDALTGAWNRRYLDAFLSGVLRSAKDARQFVTVLLFDIDNFKSFNDRHGHDAGDAILREVVDLMRSMVRPSDRVCRIGGDEFAVVFYDPQGPRQLGSRHPSSVEDIARRFQQRVATHPFPALAPGARLTISGGLATFPWDGLSPADLLVHADQLSLASKRAGKNAIVLGSEA